MAIAGLKNLLFIARRSPLGVDCFEFSQKNLCNPPAFC
jgi:hypothetical protein